MNPAVREAVSKLRMLGWGWSDIAHELYEASREASEEDEAELEEVN